MMGTVTRSQFFSGAGKQGNTMKPIEMIKSRTNKGNSLLQKLWFERATKTLD
jgi:hypothetical protein